jgi:hypothetical protein
MLDWAATPVLARFMGIGVDEAVHGVVSRDRLDAILGVRSANIRTLSRTSVVLIVVAPLEC